MGTRIARLREEAGLSQSELARRIKIRQPSLSAIESNATKTVAGPTLAGLCRELNTTAKYILEGTGDPHPPADEAPRLSDAALRFARYFEKQPPDKQQQMWQIMQVITGKAISDDEVEEKMPVTQKAKKV